MTGPDHLRSAQDYLHLGQHARDPQDRERGLRLAQVHYAAATALALAQVIAFDPTYPSEIAADWREAIDSEPAPQAVPEDHPALVDTAAESL